MTATTRSELMSTEHVRRLDAAQLVEALAVKRLAVDCYARVLGGSVLTGRSRAAVARVAVDERAHLTALARLAGARGTRPGRPSGVDTGADADDRELAARGVPQRLGQLRGSDDALNLLLSVERQAVGAAYAAIGRLLLPETIRRVAEIMGSDAQHEVVLRELLAPGDVAGAVPFGRVEGAHPLVA